jgi:hypothetical protein
LRKISDKNGPQPEQFHWQTGQQGELVASSMHHVVNQNETQIPLTNVTNSSEGTFETMRLYCSLFAAYLPRVAEGFFAAPPSTVSIKRNTMLFGYLDNINDFQWRHRMQLLSLMITWQRSRRHSRESRRKWGK